MAAGGSHLADDRKKLLEEPVFITHTPAAVRIGSSRRIIATSCPECHCWTAAGHSVQKCWLQASPCSVGEGKSTKEKEGTNPFSEGGNRGQGWSQKENPKPKKPFPRLKHQEILSSKIKASTVWMLVKTVLDDKTFCPNCCRSGAGLLLKGLRMLTGVTPGTGALLSPRLAARAQTRGWWLQPYTKWARQEFCWKGYPLGDFSLGMRPFPERFKVLKNSSRATLNRCSQRGLYNFKGNIGETKM